MVSSHLLLHGSTSTMISNSLHLPSLPSSASTAIKRRPSWKPPWSLVSVSLQWKPSSVLNRLDFFSPAM
ncbi:hypothetical protein N665_2080s0006 [Sinapis alba]|nr:hypothetical protein N665_2080s0006 [Sinapis alba]